MNTRCVRGNRSGSWATNCGWTTALRACSVAVTLAFAFSVPAAGGVVAANGNAAVLGTAEQPALLQPIAPTTIAATAVAVAASDVPTSTTLAAIAAPRAPTLMQLANAALTSTPSPARRLRLNGRARVKAETCLATAIYFEARGETLRGQIAVAQVIMNRVFSRYYPDKICDVVYQNAHRHNACQFSFACDGKREQIKNRHAWAVARYVAALTVDGKIWEPDIAKATHYHATWVNPWWVGTMRKLASLGVHIFYRPVRWGDGLTEPDWSRVAHTVVAAIN